MEHFSPFFLQVQRFVIQLPLQLHTVFSDGLEFQLLYSLEALITDISVSVAGSVASRAWNGTFLNPAYPQQKTWFAELVVSGLVLVEVVFGLVLVEVMSGLVQVVVVSGLVLVEVMSGLVLVEVVSGLVLVEAVSGLVLVEAVSGVVLVVSDLVLVEVVSGLVALQFLAVSGLVLVVSGLVEVVSGLVAFLQSQLQLQFLPRLPALVVQVSPMCVDQALVVDQIRARRVFFQ